MGGYDKFNIGGGVVDVVDEDILIGRPCAASDNNLMGALRELGDGRHIGGGVGYLLDTVEAGVARHGVLGDVDSVEERGRLVVLHIDVGEEMEHGTEPVSPSGEERL